MPQISQTGWSQLSLVICSSTDGIEHGDRKRKTIGSSDPISVLFGHPLSSWDAPKEWSGSWNRRILLLTWDVIHNFNRTLGLHILSYKLHALMLFPFSQRWWVLVLAFLSYSSFIFKCPRQYLPGKISIIESCFFLKFISLMTQPGHLG